VALHGKYMECNHNVVDTCNRKGSDRKGSEGAS
jgi:hypothetical protein